MELKVGQVWEDGNPYPNWKYIKIDRIAGNQVRYIVLDKNYHIYNNYSNVLDGLSAFMEKNNYTLSKSHNFNSLYEKLCSTN